MSREDRIAAWLAGALEPGAAAELGDEVDADDPIAASLGAALAEEGPVDDGWRLPPPSTARAVATMGPPRVGDALALPVPRHARGWLVVLTRGAGPWERVPLPDARAEDHDEVLVTPTEPGVQDWAVVVVADGRDPREGLLDGSAAAHRVRVDVSR
jgi:hypothetical protein